MTDARTLAVLLGGVLLGAALVMVTIAAVLGVRYRGEVTR